MLDYTIGDKVVCIDDEPVDCMKVIRYRVRDFQYPTKGAIYTVRDMLPPEAFKGQQFDGDCGILLHEITAGTGVLPHESEDDRGELWYNAKSFRKALPSDLDALTTHRHQPA